MNTTVAEKKNERKHERGTTCASASVRVDRPHVSLKRLNEKEVLPFDMERTSRISPEQTRQTIRWLFYFTWTIKLFNSASNFVFASWYDTIRVSLSAYEGPSPFVYYICFLLFAIISRKKAPLLVCDLSSETWVEWISGSCIITKQKQNMPQKWIFLQQ